MFQFGNNPIFLLKIIAGMYPRITPTIAPQIVSKGK